MTRSILIIGGHGKVSQLLTPLLLAKSWDVTSMIRSADQKSTIENLAKEQPGKLKVLVKSVADVRSEADAKKILEQVKPEWVIWSAGAGGKGGAEMTMAVDRDAAVFFTKASIHTPSIKKFLTVSYLSSRRGRPSWWTDKDWESAQKVNHEILPTYYKAKVAADEVLTILSKKRNDEEAKKSVSDADRFCGISLRPGTLTDEPAGKITVGKIGAGGKTSRAAVAETIVATLNTEGAKGWIDVVDGDEDINAAIQRLTKEGIDSVDEEDLVAMEHNAASL